MIDEYSENLLSTTGGMLLAMPPALMAAMMPAPTPTTALPIAEKGPRRAENKARSGVNVFIICSQEAFGDGLVKKVVTMFPSMREPMAPASKSAV